MVIMGNRQELSKLNEEIELLESAGFIKAASVLHKKFIKESQAAPQTGPQSYMTNAGIEVIRPGQTPPPVQTPPPAQTTQPSLPPNYNAYDNYYQDPRTGRNVFVDPVTMQPLEGQLGKGIPVAPPGSPSPGMNINPVPPPVNPPYEGSYTNPGGQNVPPPTQPPSFPPPGNENNQIPGLQDRYGFYFQKINDGNGLPPEQQQAYFDSVKRQIFDQLQKGLIDQKTYNDLMRLFAGK